MKVKLKEKKSSEKFIKKEGSNNNETKLKAMVEERKKRGIKKNKH